MRLHLWFASVAVVAGLHGAALAQPAPDLDSRPVGAWGVDLGDQDRSVKPGDNFYAYENGAWLARTELKPRQMASAYWRDLRLLAPRRLVVLLQAAAADRSASPQSPEGKLGAFYRAYMDEAAIEARGVTPLKPELDAIRAAASKAQLAGLMGRIEGPGADRSGVFFAVPAGRGLIRVDIAQDSARPDRYAVYLRQGGLLLPGPEYYQEAQFAEVRTAYLAYIAKILTLIGWPDPQGRARQILDLETQLAKASWSHEQLLDPVKTYNPMTVAELARFAPGFDWKAYLKGAGLPHADRVVIDARDAFPRLAEVFAQAPLDVLKARQAFAAADYASRDLNAELAAAALDFHGKMLGNGFGLSLPRDVRAEQAAEASLNGVVAALYVAHYSSPQAKAKAQDMAEAMRKALDIRIQGLAWMSPAGKAWARDKLARMRIKVGYPDHFDDYKGLEISDADAYGDIQRAYAYAWRRQVARLDQPFDRSEWSLTPQYPNYNYIPTTNTVEIPASLLQPPFFDLRADEAVNYGGLGALIGQMIMVAFTSQGIPYDGDGRPGAGLPAEDMASLKDMSGRIAAQYSRAEPLPGVHLKGELVIDEAVSDLGGLQIALDAYHASLAGRPAPALDGFTGDQRFFMGRAQMWRAKFSEAFVRTQVATGMNAPTYMRVNGPLPNIDAWYAAFDVQPGDKLYVAPQDRVRLW